MNGLLFLVLFLSGCAAVGLLVHLPPRRRLR